MSKRKNIISGIYAIFNLFIQIIYFFLNWLTEDENESKMESDSKLMKVQYSLRSSSTVDTESDTQDLFNWNSIPHIPLIKIISHLPSHQRLKESSNYSYSLQTRYY